MLQMQEARLTFKSKFHLLRYVTTRHARRSARVVTCWSRLSCGRAVLPDKRDTASHDFFCDEIHARDRVSCRDVTCQVEFGFSL